MQRFKRAVKLTTLLGLIATSLLGVHIAITSTVDPTMIDVGVWGIMVVGLQVSLLKLAVEAFPRRKEQICIFTERA
jgi:hypothetical protein